MATRDVSRRTGFADRRQAGAALADRLGHHAGRTDVVVLALPRGGVPVGAEVARALTAPLDVFVVRKLGLPGQPELAIGSIDETGHSYVRSYARMIDVSEDYLDKEKRAQTEILRERRALYTPVHPPIDPSGRVVIIVDDASRDRPRVRTCRCS